MPSNALPVLRYNIERNVRMESMHSSSHRSMSSRLVVPSPKKQHTTIRSNSSGTQFYNNNKNLRHSTFETWEPVRRVFPCYSSWRWWKWLQQQQPSLFLLRSRRRRVVRRSVLQRTWCLVNCVGLIGQQRCDCVFSRALR